MKKKRLVFVIPNLCHGGTNRVLENILSIINRDKYDISVLSLKSSLNDPYYAVFSNLVQLVLLEDIVSSIIYNLAYNRIAAKFHGIMRRWFKNSAILSAIFDKIQKSIEGQLSPDVVIAFEEGLPTMLVSKFSCYKIAWVHCDYKYYIQLIHPLLKIEHRNYEVYDKIVCVSKYTSGSFVDVFRDFHGKVSCIYNPINLERILSLSKQKINDDLFKNDIFTIVSVGRFADVKRFDRIPDIIKSLLLISNELQFRWYVIGDGNNKLMNETRVKIHDYRIEDKLILLGSRDNPYPYMKASDLYVCTSYSEAYPCVINEAKVLGTLVVSSDFPSVHEILDERTGIISSFNDIPRVLFRLLSTNKRLVEDNNGVLKSKKERSEVISKIEFLFDKL